MKLTPEDVRLILRALGLLESRITHGSHGVEGEKVEKVRDLQDRLRHTKEAEGFRNGRPH